MVYRKKTYKRKTNTNRSLKSRRRKGGEETGDVPRLLEEGRSPSPPPVQQEPTPNPPYKPVERPNSRVSFYVPSPEETGDTLVGGRRRINSKRRKNKRRKSKRRKTSGNKKVKKTYKKKSLFHRIFGL